MAMPWSTASRCLKSVSVVEPAAAAGAAPLTVTQVTGYLKHLVECDEVMSTLAVRGEICEFSRSGSGHVYFAIKDAASQLSCVLFRREAARQPDEVAELRKGLTVVVHGFLTVYEPRGQCQMCVQHVQPEGEGAARRRLERLTVRLQNEGLFAPERKRQLPPFPRSLALITAPGSQAYHDVLHRLRTQCPTVRVIVAGASVQGDRAADEMVMALDLVNRLTSAEIILLVRGGGASEDLMAFNEERLARAVFASRIPVVTGIGHESDNSIVDLVADYRAATPSLAAAAAVPDLGGVVAQSRALHEAARYAVEQQLQAHRVRWVETNRALLRAEPAGRLRDSRARLGDLTARMERALRVGNRERRLRLEALRAQLVALDPLAILSRGYAVLTEVETGRVVSAAASVRPGTRLLAQVAEGSFPVEVTE